MVIEVRVVGNKSYEFELAGRGYHLEADGACGGIKNCMTPGPLALSSRVDSDAVN